MHSTNRTVCSSKLPETSIYFKEESICQTLAIPHQNPGMLRLLDVNVWAEIDSYKMIQTEAGRSYEGQNLTGIQLSVDVKLSSKIIYVANNCEQSVHVANFETMENVFIILPNEMDNIDVCDLVNFQSITVSPYIEAVDARMAGHNMVQSCVLMLVDITLHQQQKGVR